LTRLSLGINVYQDIDAFHEYNRVAADELFTNPEAALSVVKAFHDTHKDNIHLNGITYYNLAVAQANTNQYDDAEKAVRSGIRAFTDNEHLPQLLEQIENKRGG
jgi:hypothetical protein